MVSRATISIYHAVMPTNIFQAEYGTTIIVREVQTNKSHKTSTQLNRLNIVRAGPLCIGPKPRLQRVRCYKTTKCHHANLSCRARRWSDVTSQYIYRLSGRCIFMYNNNNIWRIDREKN